MEFLVSVDQQRILLRRVPSKTRQFLFPSLRLFMILTQYSFGFYKSNKKKNVIIKLALQVKR